MHSGAWRAGANGAGALHLAAAGGHAAACRYLVWEAEASTDDRDWAGRAPLHYACRSRRGAPAVAALLGLCADASALVA
eukprot:gene56148-12569_t